jgi:hypothetical protein
MSLAGLALVLGHIMSGGGREADEGTGTRVWWLLMGGQLPVAAWFAITWLPRAPRSAPLILAVQALLFLANLAVVRYFDL